MFLAFLMGLPHESSWAFSAPSTKERRHRGWRWWGPCPQGVCFNRASGCRQTFLLQFKYSELQWFSGSVKTRHYQSPPSLLFLACFFDLIWILNRRHTGVSLNLCSFPFLSVWKLAISSNCFFWVGSLQIFIISLCFWFIEIMVWRQVRIINHNKYNKS